MRQVGNEVQWNAGVGRELQMKNSGYKTGWEKIRQVSESVGLERTRYHSERVNPVSIFAFVLTLPAAGLDDVSLVDWQA